jgi:hypothetical protein
MTQDPKTRKGIVESEMKSKRLQNTHKYMMRFEDALLKRAALWRYYSRKGSDGKPTLVAPVWSMFDVSGYTFAQWKVVWTRVASIQAAVVGAQGGKPAIPQETVTMIDTRNCVEAHFIAASANSTPFQYAAVACSEEGGKSMGTPGILQSIRLPKFDPKDKVHVGLAELSEQAHEATAKGDSERVAKIEEQVDLLAAKLWGLSDKKLKEIKLALEELR